MIIELKMLFITSAECKGKICVKMVIKNESLIINIKKDLI